jgi:hypothetical protein
MAYQFQYQTNFPLISGRQIGHLVELAEMSSGCVAEDYLGKELICTLCFMLLQNWFIPFQIDFPRIVRRSLSLLALLKVVQVDFS